MTRTIWVVNKKGHDLSGAASYGELKTLTEGSINVFAVDRNILQLRQELAASDAQDLLLICGSIPLNILASQVMMALHGKVNLLLFDLRRQQYVIRSYQQEDFDERSRPEA